MANIANKDFIFMSYDEEYADEAYDKLLKLVPTAKRVHGVKGIANAWKAAGDLAETSHFITMDADTELNEDFSFNAPGFVEDDERIHVWRSLNAVNGLVYGHGSIHMFSTQLVRDFTNTDVIDFTLNVGTKGVNIQEECATVTRFNRSPKLTWRSAFRETSKLASGTNLYVGTNTDWAAKEPVTAARLFVWCCIGLDAPFGWHCIDGARRGALHGFKYKDNPKKLAEIADYDTFLKTVSKYESCDEELKEYGLNVQDFTAEQSEALKKIWYGLSRDVVDRLTYKNFLLSQ